MQKVTNALQPLPGVAEIVNVDITTTLAQLKTDPKKFDLDNAISTLAGVGYAGAEQVRATN